MNRTFPLILVFSLFFCSCKDKQVWLECYVNNSAVLASSSSWKKEDVFLNLEKIEVLETYEKSEISSLRNKGKVNVISILSGVSAVNFIEDFRSCVTSDGVSADDFIPMYQVVFYDSAGAVIAHWRIRRERKGSGKFALVMPTGGMSELRGFSKSLFGKAEGVSSIR